MIEMNFTHPVVRARVYIRTQFSFGLLSIRISIQQKLMAVFLGLRGDRPGYAPDDYSLSQISERDKM